MSLSEPRPDQDALAGAETFFLSLPTADPDTSGGGTWRRSQRNAGKRKPVHVARRGIPAPPCDNRMVRPNPNWSCRAIPNRYTRSEDLKDGWRLLNGRRIGRR
jgi:hypothetical protein